MTLALIEIVVALILVVDFGNLFGPTFILPTIVLNNTPSLPNYLILNHYKLILILGYILGALWLAKETNTPIQKQDIHEICKITVKSGKEYAQSHNSPCPLMYAYYQVEYLGAAHGLCSILQVLLSVPEYLDSNPADATDIKRSVDFLLSTQSDDGMFYYVKLTNRKFYL